MKNKRKTKFFNERQVKKYIRSCRRGCGYPKNRLWKNSKTNQFKRSIISLPRLLARVKSCEESPITCVAILQVKRTLTKHWNESPLKMRIRSEVSV